MNNYAEACARFDALAPSVLEHAREPICEGGEDITESNIVAHLIMVQMDRGARDSDGYFEGKFSVETKKTLIELAENLGPDWAQALYHAAVFITKVA